MSTTTSAKSTTKGSLSTGRVVSYAMGDVANNLAFQMTSLFLMVYMTDVVGISAGIAGLIYGVTKIWAGVADLIAGNTVDKFDTRWGRLRPWILFGSFPLALTLVLLFSTPWDARINPAAAIAWVFLIDALFQLAYSFVNIPYGSLSAAMTQDSLDRSRLSGARSIASAVTGVALSAVVAPQFQGVHNQPLDEVRLRFTITMAILGVLAIIFYLICFKNTREVVPRSQNKPKFSTTMKMVSQNRPLLVLCLGALFLLGAMFTMNATAMYYTINILGDAGFFTFLMLAQTVGTILAASFVPAITVRLGKRKGYVAMAFVAVLGYVIIAVVPDGGLVLAIIAWFVFGVGSGGTNALMFSMQADTVDYGEWKTGIRSEGGSYSILSFVRKVGQGVGGILSGAILGAFGYQLIQPGTPEFAQVEMGMRVATGWVPAGLGIIAALILFFYPLTESQHRTLVGELNARRSAGVADDLAASAHPDANKEPVVTLFETYGSGAAHVGQKVAQRLNVTWLGQALSSAELDDAPRYSDGRDGTFDRFLRSVANRGVSDTDFGLGADSRADTSLAQSNTEEVLRAAQGGGVLLGRNATVILDDHPTALHVKLTAPVPVRVARAAEQDGIPRELATTRMAREDEIRVEMSERLYGWNPDDDAYYDLVINTGRYSEDEVVDLIVQAWESKFGAR